MTASSMKSAWDCVYRMIGYVTFDRERSERAGYRVYSNDRGDWVSDLDCRLEINRADGRSYSVFVCEDVQPFESCVDHDCDVDYKEAIQRAGKEDPIIADRACLMVTLAVGCYIFSPAYQCRIYKAMHLENRNSIALDLLGEYCKSHGIEYSCIEVHNIVKVLSKHSSGGRYVIEGIIELRGEKTNDKI